MSNNVNILITGATGFIGSHLCKALTRKGYNVFGISLSKENQRINKLLKEKNFHLQKGDILQIEPIEKIIRDNNIKVIFHLAARLPGDDDLDNPSLISDVNIKGTLNLLKSAYLNGVDKFIYVSTMSVYSEPPEYLPVDENHPTKPSTIYGISKLAGELYCGAYSEKMKITVLRYGGVYGIGQDEHYAAYRFVNQALNNEPIMIYGDGSQTSDFTYIEDLIQGTVLAMEKNSTGIYNIGSGEETSIRKLAEEIINLTKSDSKIIFTDKKTNRPFRFFLNIEKARKRFGYSPSSFEKGLSRYIFEFNKES